MRYWKTDDLEALGADEIKLYLDHLAVKERVGGGTQRLALNALVEGFERDRSKDLAGVWLPEALARKFRQAGERWEWFWFWPASGLAEDPRSVHPARFGVTMWLPKLMGPQSHGQRGRQVSRSESPRMCCGTASPRI